MKEAYRIPPRYGHATGAAVAHEPRNFPTGRLNDFQRLKVRTWAIYNRGLGRIGSVDIASIVQPSAFIGRRSA
ncbi:MAG: hypothetical protein ACE148_09925 [Vicinamibacterales bacterium]